MNPNEVPHVGLNRLSHHGTVFQKGAGGEVSKGHLVHGDVTVPSVQSDGGSVGGHEGFLCGDV